ncbi:MAG TPA: hypothetical protein VGP81_01355 [Pyrinomonadaceae bacterium]|nr:hypothetical protein [Pyrinomonadaceae bacterium]
MRRFNTLITCAVVLLLLSEAAGQKRDAKTTDLIGSYTHSSRYAGSIITIEPDGKFHIDSSDCTQEYFESGTYKFENQVLSFVTTKRTVKGHGESDDKARNLLDPKVYEEQYHQKLPADDRTSELMPVTWGDRVYLIDKASLPEFCNAINFGLEPRKELGTDWYLGSFYLRNGDEQKTAAGRPSLSQELMELLLETAVEARIINIEYEGDKQIAVIDRGRDAGLKEGMRFVFVDRQTFWDGPSLWSGLVVVSVTRDMARLKVFENANIGDKVSSKFVDPRFKDGER